MKKATINFTDGSQGIVPMTKGQYEMFCKCLLSIELKEEDRFIEVNNSIFRVSSIESVYTEEVK